MEIDNNISQFILNSIFDGLYICNLERVITFWNQGAERITGYSSSDVVGKHCWGEILIHINENGKRLCNSDKCPILRALKDGKEIKTEAYLLHKDGHRVPVHIKTTPLRDENGKITSIVQIFQDNSLQITVQNKLEELTRLAMLDPITEIGTRKYLEINLNAIFEKMKRYGWAFGVLFIDIDHFKNINDLYGHDIGDSVLKMVAKTLSKNIRSFDLIGRWGGEEFLAIIVNINDNQLFTIAEKLRILVENSSLHIGDDKISVTISTGATIAKPDDTVESLVKRVDTIMYRSKADGRNRVTFDT
jgi:diguanylate cyclase (GGDEF)-like protein/PAS domain S-box-containing protein